MIEITTRNFGRIALVNLSTGQVDQKEISREFCTMYLGGRGLGAKLLWDLAPVGVEAFSADNPLIFSCGTLNGTGAPSSGRLTVTTKGPMTDGYLKSNVGGRLGIALRMAGYDALVLLGKRAAPCYLLIDGEGIHIKDARLVWGQGVKDTCVFLCQELGVDISIACIGPAGENLVKFASIMVDAYHALGRGGVGAIMGSKNVKALVIRESLGAVSVADPRGFGDAVAESRDALYKDGIQPDLYLYGTARDIDLLEKFQILPSYNHQRGRLKEQSAAHLSGRRWSDQYVGRRTACGSCIYGCHRLTEVSSGPYQGTFSGGPEAEAVTSLGTANGITDLAAIMRANEICNDLGMDVSSAGASIGWLMETCERGLLSKEDTDGIDVVWGNAKAQETLLRKIAGRAGIGDLLAEGTKRASEKVGNDSWKWALQARGLEQTKVELRGAKGYALSFAVNPRGPDHLHAQVLTEFGGTPEAVAKGIEITGDEKLVRPEIYEKRAELVRWHEDMYTVSDCLGICSFATTAAYGIDEVKSAKLFQAFYGIPLDAEGIMRNAKGILTLERMYNLREGHRGRLDDTLPWRVIHEELPELRERVGAALSRVSPEKLAEMLDAYYGLQGWDQQGKPSIATLTELGLDFTISVLERRQAK